MNAVQEEFENFAKTEQAYTRGGKKKCKEDTFTF